MTASRAVFLAVVQGFTEFLPVSSSGHLVLLKALLGGRSPGALWEVSLHVGTLVAILMVFWREVRDLAVGFCVGLRDVGRKGGRAAWNEGAHFRMACYVLLGTVPAALAGLLLKGRIEAMFSRPLLSAAMILVTGEVLWLSRPYSLLRPEGRVGVADCVWVGLAQAAALVPGISRTGATIAAGLMRGVGREEAARFSFLLAVPAMVGAAVVELPGAGALSADELTAMLLGLVVAAGVGYVALRFLLRVVRRGKLHYFAYYCWAAGVAGIVFFWATAGARP